MANQKKRISIIEQGVEHSNVAAAAGVGFTDYITAYIHSLSQNGR